MNLMNTTNIQIQVENIKCGGCRNSIVNSLSGLPGVSAVDVDVANGQITLEAPESSRAEVVDKLRSMGYPETGTVQGLSAAVAGAKSFVSCAVGRLG
jgi:copper chaperone